MTELGSELRDADPKTQVCLPVKLCFYVQNGDSYCWG